MACVTTLLFFNASLANDEIVNALKLRASKTKQQPLYNALLAVLQAARKWPHANIARVHALDRSLFYGVVTSSRELEDALRNVLPRVSCRSFFLFGTANFIHHRIMYKNFFVLSLVAREE